MGRKNTIDVVLSFVFRYVWAICAAILIFEFAFMVHTAHVTLTSTAKNIADSSLSELQHKLSVTWKLAEALSKDRTLTDTSLSLEQRALFLKSYNDAYGLFLIGITDTTGKITSSYDDIPGDLSQRDYFKRVIASGVAEITDAFVAGADNTTANYTICVPYADPQKPESIAGTIIMSIPFKEVNAMITRTLPGTEYMFTLLSSTNTIMAERDKQLLRTPFSELASASTWMSASFDEVDRQIETGKSGSYWTLDHGQLLLVHFAPVPPTQWKLITAVNAFAAIKPVFMAFMLKGFLYLALFGGISFFGKMYTENKLKDLNALVRQLVDLQNELHRKKLLANDELGELMAVSQKGLWDELTGLPTRSVFLRQLRASLELTDINQHAALLVIDLDDLKQINDSHGHEAGDKALHVIGEVLLQLTDEDEAFVSRFGGDEFLVYLPIADLGGLPLRLEQLHSRLSAPFVCHGTHLRTRVSIGAAVHPEDGLNFEALYRKADLALYQSKKSGKNCYHIWHEGAADPARCNTPQTASA